MSEFNPQVGDRANVRYHTDVRPCTVIKRTAKTVTVRFDRAERDHSWKPEQVIGGFAAHTVNNHDQRWIIAEDLDGACRKFSLRQSGAWIEVGDSPRGTRLGQGWRHFYDFNF